MTLHEMLVDEIKDLYHAEKQLTKALPKMAKAASHEDLREAFEVHLDETREHITRLESVFEALDEKPKTKPCHGMAGIIEEGSELLQEDAEDAVLDAGLIAAAQRAEHYEIGAYGTCVAWARLLGLDDVVSLLEETLEEEKATDQKLSALAEQDINPTAVNQGRDTDEEQQEAEPRGRANTRNTGSTSRRQTSSGARTRAKAADRRSR